jgi:hypothetical protein
MFNNFYCLQKSQHLWDNVEKYCGAGQATHDDRVHVHCMLDTWDHKHTRTISNTYCFSTATMGWRTRHNVTLYVRCLSVLKLIYSGLWYLVVGRDLKTVPPWAPISPFLSLLQVWRWRVDQLTFLNFVALFSRDVRSSAPDKNVCLLYTTKFYCLFYSSLLLHAVLCSLHSQSCAPLLQDTFDCYLTHLRLVLTSDSFPQFFQRNCFTRFFLIHRPVRAIGPIQTILCLSSFGQETNW